MLELYPESAHVERGQLVIGGLRTRELAERFGTPLYVYCEETIRARAREVREAAPGARLVWAAKSFPNVAVLRLLAEEGYGALVASLGELAYARAAGLSGEQLVVHGNAKPDEQLRTAAEVGALVVLDAEGEAARAAAAGVRRVLVRATLGVEADTHEAIQTGHHGSKFGLPPDDVVRTVEEARSLGLEVAGLHVHVGSQIVDAASHEATIALLGELVVRCRDELGWTPEIVDAGGGFAVRHVLDEPDAPLGELARAVVDAVARAFDERGLAQPQLLLEPGRALVGRAGLTLYTVRSVKRLDGVTWAAVDGGMSDNPRPALYGARYTALSAARADEPAGETVSIAGLHCESGDVLIDDVALPPPRAGDLLAVPATGGYTLAMSSNYNATPRPAAVLVGGGEARVIRRRETLEDLLALET
jgi:diaminopimelate decarboxylase